MTREQAIQRVLDKFDPLIEALELKETQLTSNLEDVRQRLRDKRDSKEERKREVQAYFDALDVVGRIPSEAIDGG